MAKQEAINFMRFKNYFVDEESCREHLFRLRWPNGYCCSKCGSTSHYSAYNPSYADLHNSYAYLQTGDAVVHSGHVFIIAVNYGASDERCQCFEQAGPCDNITYWTYDQMATQKYMPFSRN